MVSIKIIWFYQIPQDFTDWLGLFLVEIFQHGRYYGNVI